MEAKLWIGVYRRLDNRAEGLDDNSPRAIELHDRRRYALHEALDGFQGWRVENWGYTDDARPHEFVEVAMSVWASPFVQAIAVPALGYIGGKLLDAAIDEWIIDPLKELIRRLRGKQDEQKILDFQIRLPDGTTIRCDPMAGDAMISLHLQNGKLVSLNYNASRQEIAKMN